jgi:hypothetical protein
LQDEQRKFEYVKYLEKSLGINSMDDWKNVSVAAMKDVNLPPKWR